MSTTRSEHVYSYTLKDGRTRYYCLFYFQTWDGRRVKKKKSGFQTVREAKAWEQEFIQSHTSAPSITFKALCIQFLEDYKLRARATTFQAMQSSITRYFLPAFGAIPIGEVTPQIIRKWQNQLKAESELSPSTLAMYHKRLCTLFHFAVKFCGLRSNPVTLAGGMGTKRTPPGERLHYWTREQFDKFITGDLPPKYVAVFSLLFWTGCRVGEILALTPNDYDAEKKLIHITKTAHRRDGGTCIAPPKTASSRRDVTLPTFAAMILEDWMKRTDARGNDILFELNKSTVRREFRRYADKAGLPRIRVHDLRHSHASMLINKGVAPKLIQERLGHASITITLDIYSHLYQNQQGDLARFLSE